MLPLPGSEAFYISPCSIIFICEMHAMQSVHFMVPCPISNFGLPAAVSSSREGFHKPNLATVRALEKAPCFVTDLPDFGSLQGSIGVWLPFASHW